MSIKLIVSIMCHIGGGSALRLAKKNGQALPTGCTASIGKTRTFLQEGVSNILYHRGTGV